ncbi:hypothetical protein YC2023_098824 [Brassica napus]
MFLLYSYVLTSCERRLTAVHNQLATAINDVRISYVNERRSLVTRATTVGLVVVVHLEMAKRSYWIHHHSIVCVNVSKALAVIHERNKACHRVTGGLCRDHWRSYQPLSLVS